VRTAGVRVCAATIHTAPGTTDRALIAKVKAQFRMPKHMDAEGYGSDHFPISVDLQFAVTHVQ
jgi:hypothetical protein